MQTDTAQYPASFWSRAGASILDGLVFLIPIFIIASIIGIEIGSKFSESWKVQAVQALYMAILPVVWHGYTVGKRAADIHVVKRDGSAVGFGTMLLREFVGKWLLGTFTFGIVPIISIVMVAVRPDKLAVHDMIAGTIVVRS
ncbi:RDD family protein [Microbacteriaceae bacterium 4G12]